MSRLYSAIELIVVKQYRRLFAYAASALVAYLATFGVEIFWSFSKRGESHTMLPLAAVVFCAVIGGLGSGLIATAVTTIALLYWLPPTKSLAIESEFDQIWLMIFVVIATGLSFLGAALKNALQKGRQASRKLEETVGKRTSELVHVNEELRRLLGQIKRSEHFLDLLIENIPSIIYVKDAKDLKFVRVNKAVEQAIGRPANQLIGKTVFDVVRKELAEEISKQDQEVILTGKPLESELHYSKDELAEKVMFTRRIPIFDENRKIIYILAIADDVTEKKKAEARTLDLIYEQAARVESDRQKMELQQALSARDIFLSVSSHELKNPLTSLKLQTGIVKMLIQKHDERFLFSDRMKKLMEETDGEIDRVLRMIEDMLDVSRIRSGKLSVRLENADLSRIVSEVVERFKMDPEYKDIPVSVRVPESANGIWDRHRIEQVVVNLLSNAFKYGQGKPILISVRRLNGRYELIVEDHGIGISPEHRGLIFQRFERADAPESITGLGLGLYIVKEIVNRHRGSIRVESEKGKGSRFIVELPAMAQASAA